MKEKFKLTALEKSWILYDVGNSAFILLVTTLVPIFFNALAKSAGLNEDLYLSYWGYAGSIATILVAILGPICGTLADRKMKKQFFLVTMLVGALCCAVLGFAPGWLAFLCLFILARVGYSSSLIFYDSMLPEITSETRMDKVSSMGYAFGYIGSVIPFVVCLVLVLMPGMFGLTQGSAMVIAFLITAVWWIACTAPLLRRYRQTAFVTAEKSPLLDSFRQLGRTIRDAKKEKHIFVYLLAFFFFIDGVYTIIDMATAYGTALGLDTTGLLLALLGLWNRRNLLVFLAANVATQLAMFLLLGTTALKEGVGFGYYLLFIPLELVILLAETVAYRRLFTGASKRRATVYGISANLCSAVLGWFLAEPVWKFIVSIS